MRISGNKLRRAFTLVEMMMTVGCSSLILAAVITAGVALQRSFAAVEDYSIAVGNQMRVLDYIAMDSRRCYSASVTTDVNNIPTLTLTVPNYYDANGNPVNPGFYDSTGTLVTGSAQDATVGYGGGTTPISYYIAKDPSGKIVNFMRQVGPDPSKAKAIATNISSFTITPQDLNSNVTCRITFLPKFTSSGANNGAGTTVYCNVFLQNPRARQ
jgi:hypothetical protein